MMVTITFALLLLFAGAGQAQPVADAAVNTASFASADLPNGSLAQGSMFAVFGSNLGPEEIEEITAFPLPLELGGTSIQVTVGDTTVDCIMIFSLSTQLAAILPSDTPVGAGTLTVTRNGQISDPLPINVVAHSFGIFAINTAGSGPGVFTDQSVPQPVVNTLLDPATPGSVWTLWGTGLGPVEEDERLAPPVVMDMVGVDVDLLVGGQQANITYRGRTPCCAGIDQINFIVPSGVTGCYVPVVVVVEGVPSNFTTMSIAESGSTCSDPSGGFTAEELETARSNGAMRLGTINLSRTRLSFEGEFPAQVFEITTDTASASFSSFDIGRLVRSQGFAGISTFGACTVFQFSGSQDDIERNDPIEPDPLDAGPSLSLSGPGGTAQLEQQTTGDYFAQLSGGFPGFLTAALKGVLDPKAQVLEGFLEPGQYTVSGSGGEDVGMFMATLQVPEALVWANEDAISSVNRSQGLPITWTGGGSDQTVQIFGFSASSATEEEATGAFFTCRERASAGMFTVPSQVLLALPASVEQSGFPVGILGVGLGNEQNRFEAPGIDVGVFGNSDLILKNVAYQ